MKRCPVYIVNNKVRVKKMSSTAVVLKIKELVTEDRRLKAVYRQKRTLIGDQNKINFTTIHVSKLAARLISFNKQHIKCLQNNLDRYHRDAL